MQNRICFILKRPFPLFLSYRKGRIYFIWMISILVILANILQPFGLIDNHEFHKPLVLGGYIFVFFMLYALQYSTFSFFLPRYYKPESWTLKKELQVLMIFLPVAACITFLYAFYFVPEFKPGLPSFIEVQSYNILLSVISIPVFGFYVDNRLNPLKIARRKRLKESHLVLSKKNCRDIMQQLYELMETQQPYLSAECSVHLIAGLSGIPHHHVSYAINRMTDSNFNDFINKYRVEQVCLILQNGPNKKFKLETIGSDCGFGCKVSFYTTFKKFTGKTPAEYQAGLKNQKKPK